MFGSSIEHLEVTSKLATSVHFNLCQLFALHNRVEDKAVPISSLDQTHCPVATSSTDSSSNLACALRTSDLSLVAIAGEFSEVSCRLGDFGRKDPGNGWWDES